MFFVVVVLFCFFPCKKSSLPHTQKKKKKKDKHPAAESIAQSAKNEPKYKIHVLRKGNIQNFIIGDSNLRTTKRKKTAQNWGGKKTKKHVPTMPGAKVADVTASLKTRSVRGDVRRVFLHTGGNDVYKHYIADDLKCDYQQLLLRVKRVFSAADIAVPAPLHRKPVASCFKDILNSALDDECIKNEVLFILE